MLTMKAARRDKQSGNVLVCALCTILIVSMIGGSVLLNCTARYNVSSNQVRGWKEALQAAEANVVKSPLSIVDVGTNALVLAGSWRVVVP